MALKLRALGSLAEDPGSLSAPIDGSQPFITTVSGDPKPSSISQRPLYVHKHTFMRMHHSHKQIQFFLRQRFSLLIGLSYTPEKYLAHSRCFLMIC